MAETVGGWKARKAEQCRRAVGRHPRLGLQVEKWEDFGTKFALLNSRLQLIVLVGALGREETGQTVIDLDDAEIDASLARFYPEK